MQMTVLAFLRFETPGYLMLLGLIPLIVLLSFRSLSGLGLVRRIVAIACRSMVVLLMVLALAGASRSKTVQDLTTLFLVDRSSSIPRDLQKRGFEFVQRADGARGKNDRVGVIAFDGRTAIEQLPMSQLVIDRLGEPLEPDQTGIAAALRLGLALFPPDSARRIVLLTDGNENIGDALAEADQFRAARAPIDVLPITYVHTDEVVFEQLRAPPTASTEETINLQMVLRSQKPTRGQILLYHNEELVELGGRGAAGHPVDLDAGPNRFTIPVPLRAAGTHRFRAVFEPLTPGGDTLAANNEGRAFTLVSGQSRVLILTTADDLSAEISSARLLAEALRREQLESDVELAGENPIDQVRLLEYGLVVLSNVPKNDLTDEAIASLAVYVRDLGGGLIMIGGDASFGAGGWLDTPIEAVMPVSFDVKNEKQIPKGALVLVMHACEVPNGNYLGERCAVAAIKTLSSRDLVGVLSYRWQSDQQGFWDIPLQTVGNKTDVVQQVLKMQMGDMPDLHEVMEPGVMKLIERKDAAAKHMIIISDFDPQAPGDDLIRTMKQNGITCSTVAIGYGGHWIDEGKARWIADSTGGKFYATSKFDELPSIFIKEARIVRRSLINEVTFTPALTNTLATTVSGLADEGLPELNGYVLTTAKPAADVPLVRVTEEGKDPILAHWQVGLGKAVAFTSGMWPRWGASWASWPKFTKFWGQLVRWASRQSDAAALDVRTSIQGGIGKISIESAGDGDGPIAGLSGAVITPEQESIPLKLTQIGPGRYEGEFDARGRGNYIVNLGYRLGVGPEAVSGSLRTGVSVAYSPEFEQLQANLPFLNELAARAGGRVLAESDVAAPFLRAGLPRVETRRPIWEDLIRWMLVLFLIDVAVRRIAVHPAEVARRIRRFIADMAGARQKAEESAAVLTTLKGTRDRARGGRPAAGEAGSPPMHPARYEPPEPPNKATEDLGRALGGATEMDAPVVAKPTRKKPATDEADYTSRLKQAKRRAKDDMQSGDEAGA